MDNEHVRPNERNRDTERDREREVEKWDFDRKRSAASIKSQVDQKVIEMLAQLYFSFVFLICQFMGFNILFSYVLRDVQTKNTKIKSKQAFSHK